MAYGKGEYGERGFGGSSFETGGPTVASSDPFNGETGVDPSATVSLTIQSTAGLDLNTLNVDLDGIQAMVGGEFLPGYTGTVTQDVETAIEVVFATHQSFPGGATPIDIDISDLAGLTGPLSFSFTVDSVVDAAETLTLSEAAGGLYEGDQAVAEASTLSEALAVSQAHFIEVAESVSLVEVLEDQLFLIKILNGETVEVHTPFGLRTENTGNLSNYSIRPADDVGYPVSIQDLTVGYDVFASGSTCQVEVDEEDPDFTSDILTFPIGTPFEYLRDIGGYIEILSGPIKGTYRIVDLPYLEDVPGWKIPYLVPRIQIDRRVPYTFAENGLHQGLVEYVGPGSINFLEQGVQYRDTSITEENPLQEILHFEILHPERNYVGASSEIIDFNTFEITYIVNGAVPGSDAAAFARLRTTGRIQWRLTSAVTKFTFETSKLTGGAGYLLSFKNLFMKLGRIDFSFDDKPFMVEDSVVQKPRINGATISDEGVVFIEYDQAMQVDTDNLLNPDDYAITGPTQVNILGVFMHDPVTIALPTSGLEAGDYTLTVSTSTPKDIAGNPLDPVWNQVVFTAAVPLNPRSIFTDRGPITKPALTILSGINAVLETFTEVTLPGAALTVDHLGRYLTLGGSSLNDGTFRISSIISPTRARVQASFTFPDASSGSLTWEVFDPQDGLVADDPADVTVRVNGSPVTPDAVTGLLGQIVLNATPSPTDDVEVDYSCMCNPTVDFRRLNSREFRLNAWNRDLGYPTDDSQHKYRFNNVLVRPADYEALDTRAILDQPEERELHYRAYERAYTPVLNDPSLLLLNSPIHKIAYPPAQRVVSEEFVSYEATGLPEDQVVNPWERVGLGTATVSSSGYLTIVDDSSGDYPTGQPLFWTREIDLTFPHVFAMSWRFSLDIVAEFDGVFSGVAAGYSDDEVAAVVGYLEEGGVKKVGILKRGYGDDPGEAAAWIGGLDTNGDPTGLPVELDWSALRSFRILRDQDGTLRVYVDGDIDETLRVTSDELPFLAELGTPFDALQGAFFGSISRPARNTSEWDFIRYLIQPTNPVQTSPSSFVSYEANVVPESASSPWTPVGFHGTATIISADFLLLDSTSASDVDVGHVGGDYRGYLRFEPLLSLASEFVVDVDVQLRTLTHGVAPDGLMFAIDDGTRLMQVAFFADQEAPKVSYGGRSLPEDFSPYAWTSLGGATAEMAGRILLITDASITDGKVYSYDDTHPAGSSNRVVESTVDSILEFRCQVLSYVVDMSGFAGAFGHYFDGTRSVGIMLQEDAGTKYVAFQSDGVYLGTRFAFDWDDGAFHTYRITKSTSGNLVVLFIDGVFQGSLAYSSFTAPGAATTGQISFGSSTPASSGSLSEVEWAYCNAWRVLSSPKRYVGLWKGTDDDTLLGYHLPLKASGRAATASGNTLGDPSADFVAAGVAAGDPLVVDAGPNRGVHEVQNVIDSQNLALVSSWAQQPSTVDYRIVKETDWSTLHHYRLARDSSGTVSLLFDTDTDPLIQVDYGPLSLPISGVGIVQAISDGLPAIVFGSFNVENLAQSYWDFVRYGITRSPTEMRIAPHHQFLNQWNVMASPEHLFTQTPHEHTDYKSSSTGQPPKTDPDFMADIRENLFLHSQDFANSYWSRIGGSLVSDAVVAPDDLDGHADEFIEDSATSDHQAAYVAIGSSSTGWAYGETRVTLSVYAKMTGRRWLRLLADNLPGANGAWFDLQEGVVGSTDILSANNPELGIETVEDGWYRCWVSFIAPNAWHQFMIAGAADDGATSTYAGLGSSAFYLFGAQLSRTDGMGEYVQTETMTFIPMTAFTVLNEGTPLVPLTQTFEARAPYPTQEPVSALNRPEDILNSDGDFVLNDGALRFRLVIPDDVLYSSLDVIEQTTGEQSLIAPVGDECQPNISGLTYTDEVCLTYEGDVLPENDTAAPTPWSLVSDTPGDVNTTVFSGILTYSTAASKTVYRNNTPLPDAVSLQTEVRFRLKLLEDWSMGTGDTKVRFGLSAPGMTLALAFKTLTTGDRFLFVLDQNSGAVVGAARFDYLDGLYHDYRIVRDPSAGTVQVFID